MSRPYATIATDEPTHVYVSHWQLWALRAAWLAVGVSCATAVYLLVLVVAA